MTGNFMRKALLAAAIASPLAALPVSAQANDQEPLKIGFVYVSPIGEAGWTWQQDIGRREMEEALKGRVVTQQQADLHHLVWLHEPDAESGQAVSGREVRALYRLQDGS
uniref:BMP family ABC transporter substrate-binding protein n=1 Tax=Panagrolaimus superbus TaxID=310955 RepID=A0A914Z5B0_9BILA